MMGARSYGQAKKRGWWHLDKVPRIRSCLFVLFAIFLYFEATLIPAMLFPMDGILAAFLGNLITGGVLFWLYVNHKCGIRQRVLVQPGRRDYIWWSVIFVVSAFLLEFLFYFVNTHVTDQGMAAREASIEGSIVLFLILSIFIAPFAEEILMRLFCYNVLRSGFSRFTAMMASSLLFAALHGTMAHMVAATLLGCILALSYEATGKWFMPVIGHYLYNLLVLFGFNESLLSMTESFLFMVFDIALVSLVLFLCWRKAIGTEVK